MLLIGVGSVALIMYSERRAGPFWDKYQSIQEGMTQKEVESILGPPAIKNSVGGMSSDQYCVWEEGNQRIVVDFNVTITRHDWDHGAIRKRFLPKTTWEKTWEWLSSRTGGSGWER